MSWTDDRVATLKKLWGEGKTAAEIAKELGGVTRNAVIGKAHRLKLSNRVSPIQQNKKPATVAKVAAVAKTPANSSAPSKPAAVVEKKIEKALAPKAVKKKTGPSIPLIDLKANQCRWADGDPRDEDFGFCGCRTVSGLPYCPEHAKVAYQAATRNRILKAEEVASENEEVSVEELEMAKKAVNN